MLLKKSLTFRPNVLHYIQQIKKEIQMQSKIDKLKRLEKALIQIDRLIDCQEFADSLRDCKNLIDAEFYDTIEALNVEIVTMRCDVTDLIESITK